MNERIVALIKSLGIKKAEFAARLNLSQAFISEICSGKKSPSDRTIIDICRVFGVRDHWLRTGEGEMFRSSGDEAELTAMFSDLLREQPSFKHRLISVLLRMTPDEWKLLEKKCSELMEEMKKDGL